MPKSSQASIPQPAGASTFDQAGLTTIGSVITMGLMFIGGSPTSTAGGIKTTTLFIIILFLFKTPNENGNLVYKNRKLVQILLIKLLNYYFIL